MSVKEMESAATVSAAGAPDDALYPSYKSLDDYIDVGALRALDGFLTERIEAHIAAEKDDFFLNQHRLDDSTPYRPGVREIWLTRTLPGVPYDYLDLDKPELWQRTQEAEEFAPLMAFIDTLPFAATGRILIIYDTGDNEVPAHRDHLNPEICHEFIWMRSNFAKSLYMLNPGTGERVEVASHSAWFDSVNQYHGAQAAQGLAFSVRVDGVFTDELRKHIPFPAANRSAAPAIWASQDLGD
jgi:hypothetical protein